MVKLQPKQRLVRGETGRWVCANIFYAKKGQIHIYISQLDKKQIINIYKVKKQLQKNDYRKVIINKD